MADSDVPPSPAAGTDRAPIGPRVALGAGLHFLVLGSWYCLRPLRDEIPTFDPDSIAWLWTAVFLAMLVVSPAFGWLAHRVRRRTLLATTYLTLIAVLATFALLVPELGSQADVPDAPRLAEADVSAHPLELAFYVFCSVYALFAVSVMWSYLADRFTGPEAMRWFGPIAAAGTLGMLTASTFVSNVAERIEPARLLWVPAGLLGLATLAIFVFDRHGATAERVPSGDRPVEGSLWTGISVVFRTRMLQAIVCYMFLASVAGSFLYHQQSLILNAAFDDRGESRAFLAGIDQYTSVLTLLSQLFLNAWLLKRIGVGSTLAALPLLLLVAFAVLGGLQLSGVAAATLLPVLATIQVLRRGASYSLSKPTKEYLFTLVTREQKYASKNFIDTVVYRGSDTVGIQTSAALKAAGLGAGALALTATPIALVWIVVSLWIGRVVKRRIRSIAAGDGSPGPEAG